MDVTALQAAARAKLQQLTEETAPVIVQHQVPKVERPAHAAYVLEAAIANFSILVNGRRIMFTNYRFETDDASLAEAIIREYSPRIWRVQ
jgi:hypothetical protein